MLARLRTYTVLIEAGLLGLFFVQALRFAIGALYSRVASASLLSSYAEGTYNPDIVGIVDPSVVSNEIMLIGVVVALPLLSLLIGRFRLAPLIGALTIVGGRALMTYPTDAITQLMAAEIAVGAGLFYLCTLVAQRAKLVPYYFVFGFALDQVIRAFGNTLDPTLFEASRYWNAGFRLIDFFQVLIVLLVIATIVSVLNIAGKAEDEVESLRSGQTIDPNRGLLTFWGALGMGGLLFVELSLLALPNAIMGRAGTELYQLFVTLTLVATLLPLIPEVRAQARAFIAPFDPTTRGWIWLIFIALMIVVGTRIQRLPLAGSALVPLGGFALIFAQAAVSMMWWWAGTSQNR